YHHTSYFPVHSSCPHHLSHHLHVRRGYLQQAVGPASSHRFHQPFYSFLLFYQHYSLAANERHEQAGYCQVESQRRMHHCSLPLLFHLVCFCAPHQVVGQSFVLDHHPLWLACRS